MAAWSQKKRSAGYHCPPAIKPVSRAIDGKIETPTFVWTVVVHRAASTSPSLVTIFEYLVFTAPFPSIPVLSQSTTTPATRPWGSIPEQPAAVRNMTTKLNIFHNLLSLSYWQSDTLLGLLLYAHFDLLFSFICTAKYRHNRYLSIHNIYYHIHRRQEHQLSIDLVLASGILGSLKFPYFAPSVLTSGALPCWRPVCFWKC